MSKASILRNRLALASMTTVTLALCTGFAEARGVGVTHQSLAQEPDAKLVGRATNAPMDFQEMSQADGVIVAERTQVQVSASEFASLLEDLRLQLAAQPAATLSIRWQLIRPAEAK